ncbi:hypothetical protein [Cyclobacterium xiamenense]|uniref:hypothetical protein n=1 Tax=Cyclobacterium xiamenense TaxID=1297121 RepID=UPI0035D0DF3C
MKTFFLTTQNLALFLAGLGVFSSLGQALAQNFTSVADGEWQQTATWSSSTSCSSHQNLSHGFPPISKNWGCAISVGINHEVTFNGNASGFGSGTFSGLSLGSNAKLIFNGDLTINGGGSVPQIVLEEGAELIVNGQFVIDRKVSIVVPNNAKMTVREFVIGNNQPTITVEEGGMLEVLETTVMRSNANLNVYGVFETVDLNYTSGGTVTVGAQSGTALVTGDLEITNGTLEVNGDGSILVEGTTSTGQSGSIRLANHANGRFMGNVTMGNGGSLQAENNATFTFEEYLQTSGGATITLRNAAMGVIKKDVTMTNGSFHLHNTSEIFVGGKLTASNGGSVNGKNNTGFFICDYPNSTQRETYHISMQNNAFYGEGCLALPVVWKSVSVSPLAVQGNQLVWKTAKETASSHYEIERSIGGVGNFQKLGEVTAAGWTTAETRYTFEDRRLDGAQGMVYYRLKQVDFTGESDYSQVVSTKVVNHAPVEVDWTAFPNPSNGSNLQVKVSRGVVSGPVRARFSSGSSSVSFEGEVGMALDQWLREVIQKASKGVCVLELVYNGKVDRIKIMKV